MNIRFFFIAATCTSMAFGCSRSDEARKPPTEADQPPAPKEAPKPVEESPFVKIRKESTLEGALKIATPLMEDQFNKVDDGTLALGAWSAKSLRWSAISPPKDETSFALVMKDPDEERGKRLCVPGHIIQISVEKADFGKFNHGLIMSDAGNLYRFLAVGSSGSLVAQSTARLCGVVTGRYDYSNSAGGTGHAVKLVGMFDLPENKGGSS